MVMVIINHRLCIAITFHNVLHGFRAGRSTGNDSCESKLIQKLTDMKE